MKTPINIPRILKLYIIVKSVYIRPKFYIFYIRIIILNVEAKFLIIIKKKFVRTMELSQRFGF